MNRIMQQHIDLVHTKQIKRRDETPQAIENHCIWWYEQKQASSFCDRDIWLLIRKCQLLVLHPKPKQPIDSPGTCSALLQQMLLLNLPNYPDIW